MARLSNRLSKVERLSREDREWFEQQLIEQRFAGYEQLVKLALEERGIEISVSSAHRFGKTFKERLQAIQLVTEQARAVVQTSPDEEGAVNDALMRLIQEKLFTVVLEAQLDTNDISKVTRAIADLARASVSQKKMAAEVRKQALEEAAKAAESTARLEGLSDAGVEAMRAAIMGEMQK